jgi:O-antigen ligase
MKLKDFTQLIQKRIFQLLVFFLPSQLGKHFWLESSKVFGIRIDYLSPTLYFTDLLIVILLIVFFADKLIGKRKYTSISLKATFYFCILFIFVSMNIFYSASPVISAYKWLKVLELSLFSYFVYKVGSLTFRSWIITPLVLSVFYIVGIEICQLIFQKSLGGVFYLLGERRFYPTTPGIALVTIFGKSVMRPYSTFSHPNSLAGFLLVGLLLYLASQTSNVKMKLVVSALIVIGILVTFSDTAILTLIVISGLIFIQRKSKFDVLQISKIIVWLVIVSSMLLPFFTSNISTGNLPQSIVRRVQLAVSSGQMVANNPLLGVGLGGFVRTLPNYIFSNDSVWWLQPVHNIYLLLLSETGIVGLTIFLLIIIIILKRFEQLKRTNSYLMFVFLAIIITGFNDHYWITLQQNQLMLALILGLSIRKKLIYYSPNETRHGNTRIKNIF